MGDELEIAGQELDWLDRRLRDDAAYIDDCGFTAAVVQKLPVRRTRRSLRATILIAAAVLASALTYVLSGGGSFIFEAFARAELFSPITILISALLIGLLISGAGAFVAVRRSSAGS
jgi:hypothetical protein